MKNIFSGIITNLCYALRSAKFWIAAVAYLLIMIFYSDADELYQRGEGVYYILHYTLKHGAGEFALAVCAIPAATIFADDWCSGRFIFSYTRARKSGYAISLILSSFLIAALVSIISISIYITIFSFTNPITGDITNRSFLQITRSYANGGLMKEGHYFTYYLITILTQSCYIGIFSAMSAMLSIKLTNQYIAIVMPLILGMVMGSFMEAIRIPYILIPSRIFSQNTWLSKYFDSELDLNYNFSLISMIYPFIYTIAILTILAVISYFWINNKQEKSLDIR